MCHAVADDHLVNLRGYNLMSELGLDLEDGEQLDPMRAANGQAQGPRDDFPEDDYSGEDYTFEEQVEDEDEISWEELVHVLRHTYWQPLGDSVYISEMSRIYAVYVFRAFSLHKTRATQWLYNDSNEKLLCLCREGVFMFTSEFEYARLVARKRSDALEFILGESTCGFEGPTRIAGEPYDFRGRDEFVVGEFTIDDNDFDFIFDLDALLITSFRGNGVVA